MLSNIFKPKSIAIIGASTQSGTVGNDILKNLLTQGYKGQIFPINPKADSILDTKSYPSVLDLGVTPDMAIVVVPAKIVPSMMEQIAQKGIKSVIIISAGFREVGEAGGEIEDKVKQICLDNNITLIGPNCLGVITPSINMNASFANSIPPVGNIAFLSQSGAICTAVIDCAVSRGLGFSKFMSLGNKTLCAEAELFEYLGTDPETKVIAVYAEMIENAPKIIEIVSKINKPIIVLKAGCSDAGSSASSSHTGALASSDILFDTLFRQSNILRASSIEELFNIMSILSNNNITKLNNVAIITNAGGPGVLTTDAISNNGLELSIISEKTVDELKNHLPAHANFYNPIDLIGDAKADRYKAAIEILAQDDNVDCILTILTPQTTTEIDATAKILVEIKNKYNKPIVASFIGEDKVKSGVKILVENGVAHCHYPDQAGKAIAMISQVINPKTTVTEESKTKTFDKATVQSIFDEFVAKGESYIPEARSKEIMSHYGIHSAKSQFCKTAKEASELVATTLSGKLVMKIISPDIIHKSDVGGVMLGIMPQDAESMFDKMIEKVSKNAPNAKLEGILFAEMIDLSDGFEFILGAKKDPNLGTAIMVGFGGIYVEIFKDVVFGFPPLSNNQIDIMIDQLKSKHILDGARGQDPLDVAALKQCIQNLSQFLIDFPQVSEVDLNPILVMKSGMGVKALDAKIMFE